MKEGIKALDVEDIELGAQSSRESSYDNTRWRDLPWAILYYISLIFSMFMAGYLISKDSNETATDTNSMHFDFDFTQVFLAFLASLVFTFLWLFIVVKCAKCIIKTSLILTPILLTIGGIICIAVGAIVMGVILIIMALISALYAWCVWSRVPFAAACLKIAVHVFCEFWSPIIVNLFMGIICLILLAIDIVAFIGVTNHVAAPGLQALLVFVMFFLIYWHNIVTINVAHVTACGVMGTWVFSDVSDGVTGNSFKRAITTSFGSICFGSLIEAVIRALSALCRYLERQDHGVACTVILCVLRCLLNILGDIVDYINSYAFVYVALYGTAYIQSAKDLWAMFKRRGIEALINDDLTTIPLYLGAVFNAILIVLVCVAYADFDWNVVIALIIGLVIYFCIVYALISYIKTLFVCWTSDPATFSDNRREEFMQIVEAANKYGYNTNWCQDRGQQRNIVEKR